MPKMADRYPDFLCVGAVKSGTTWLYENLRQHPEIWLPPIKELHYFDSLGTTRAAVMRSILKGQSRHPRVTFKKMLMPSNQHRGFYARYLFSERSDEWYQSLFFASDGRVTGDITPSYARLNSDVVAYVHRRMPGTKIIYLLRDPIQRSWSQASMHFSWQRKPDDTTLAAYLLSPRCVDNSNYLINMARWEPFYPASQIFIGFLDEIEQEPEQFLVRLFSFLGVDTAFAPYAARHRIYVGEHIGVPKSVGLLLAEAQESLLHQLHAHFRNKYTRAWIDRASGYSH